MGAVCSHTEGSKTDREIMKYLKDERKAQDSTIKILLLGTGESGKTTIAKQMKILYIKGFDQRERELFRVVIHANIVSAIKCLVAATIEFKIQVQQQALIEKVVSWPDDPSQLNSDSVAVIKKLWDDTGIQEAYRQRSKFTLVENSGYNLDHVDKLSDAGYVPTDQDILRARSKTTGIHEIEFQVEGTNFKLVDVGGQRSERRKWIHCFEDVTSILFITAASEFDQTLVEDPNVNRMQESLKLFKEICNSKWFTETSIILFFNKQDIFSRKNCNKGFINCVS